MKKVLQQCSLLLVIVGLAAACVRQSPEEEGLKDALEGKFYMGAALNDQIILGKDKSSLNILQQHFNSVTAENVMKSGPIQPVEGEFVFDVPDRLIELGVENDLYVVGHCLVWHSQAPGWFFVDEEGNDVSREVLIERMKTHITTVVTRYKGKVDAWDVVNEAFEDDGTWRQSPFYRIIGENFIHLAFEFAQEADPEAEFMYNDYNLYIPSKRDAVIKLVKSLKEAGLQIDGVGMQGHYGLNSPANEDVVNSIVAFSETGVQVHITELDISVLPSPYENAGANISDKAEYTEFMNPYKEGLPEEIAKQMNERWVELFDIFLSHQDKIKRVTTWGVADPDSWKNGWPIRGRTDYPLLFDRQYEAKDAVGKIIEKAKE
jgi:endo-1,4-beta-xylanase